MAIDRARGAPPGSRRPAASAEDAGRGSLAAARNGAAGDRGRKPLAGVAGRARPSGPEPAPDQPDERPPKGGGSGSYSSGRGMPAQAPDAAGSGCQRRSRSRQANSPAQRKAAAPTNDATAKTSRQTKGGIAAIRGYSAARTTAPSFEASPEVPSVGLRGARRASRPCPSARPGVQAEGRLRGEPAAGPLPAGETHESPGEGDRSWAEAAPKRAEGWP
jgi:hypothetical protein